MATVRTLDLTPAPPDAPAPARLPNELFVEIVRLLIVGICTAVGHALAAGADGAADAGDQSAFVGALLGACLGYVVGGIAGRVLRRAMGGFEERVDQAPATSLLAGALGAAILGVVGGVVGIPAVVVLPGAWGLPVLGLSAWIGVYAGFQAGARKGEELLALLRSTVGAAGDGPLRPRGADAVEAGAHPLVLLDSSAAIDGRLAAVVGSGFLPGPLAVPRFVLDELQSIADAADPARRRRGHRALEMLDTLREGPGLGLMVLPDEVPEWEEVEAKLVALSHRLGAVLLTVDEPLAKAAELSGVRCLSLQRLAQSLQPVLVPGEVIRLTVSRHGRDEGQGVGYLDDGTMVVVSDGADVVGTAVDVAVTSSVQTSRGRMFFATLAGAGR